MNDIIKNKYFWIAVVAGLIIGDIIGVSIARSTRTTDDTLSATTSPYSIIISDQMAGDSVIVEEAVTDVSTWLSVRENNGDLLGRILGARRIDPGEWGGVVIDLLRPTTANLMYAITLYRDDGDGLFDHKIDAIIEEDGAPIMYRFVAR